MGMPAVLVLVRHGRSEGNVAQKLSRKGNHDIFEDERMRNRHSSNFRLVADGRKELVKSGKWIIKHIGPYFDRYYVSYHIRAMESAPWLGLPNAEWFPEFLLGERDWGDMDNMSEAEKRAKFAESLRKRDIHPFYWRPDNGESIAGACMRVDRVIDTLHRECNGKRVIIVNHGELMWAWRVRLERMSISRYLELDSSDDPKDHIDNGHILIYTRIDPKTGRMAPSLNWMKSISPSHPVASREEWVEIFRPRYTNDDLLKIVERVPQIIS